MQARFRAGKAYITASSGEPVAVSVAVDSHAQPPVLIQESRLYTVFDGDAYGEHTLAVDVPKPGFEAFTLSFG